MDAASRDKLHKILKSSPLWRQPRMYPPRVRKDGDAFFSLLTEAPYVCKSGLWLPMSSIDGVQTQIFVGVNYDGHLTDEEVADACKL